MSIVAGTERDWLYGELPSNGHDLTQQVFQGQEGTASLQRPRLSRDESFARRQARGLTLAALYRAHPALSEHLLTEGFAHLAYDHLVAHESLRTPLELNTNYKHQQQACQQHINEVLARFRPFEQETPWLYGSLFWTAVFVHLAERHRIPVPVPVPLLLGFGDMFDPPPEESGPIPIFFPAPSDKPAGWWDPLKETQIQAVDRLMAETRAHVTRELSQAASNRLEPMQLESTNRFDRLARYLLGKSKYAIANEDKAMGMKASGKQIRDEIAAAARIVGLSFPDAKA